MSRARLYLYDTTLRDGQQTQGVDFSATEKARIAIALDAIGIDHIEGGWPGANPTDSAFFDAPPQLKTARLTAFGMTRRAGRSTENDELLSAVLNAGTQSVCLVGKTHVEHVARALGVSTEANLEAIRASLAHVVAQGREAIFDAEHFFDGFKADPDYALSCLQAAAEAGARWIVLCDTNGGSMPGEVAQITRDAAMTVSGERLGVHAHDDTGQAVAISLAAVEAGARMIQGTLTGLGERCGNADLATLIPTLLLKPLYAERFETGVDADGLTRIAPAARLLDELLNRAPNRQAPYIGASAFAHKAGLHASAVARDPATYEHVPPEAVGNTRIVPMSDQAGRANLVRQLGEAGLKVAPDDPRLAALLDEVKTREARGWAYDSAGASFELLARRALGALPHFFELERWRVTVERRKGPSGEALTLSEAVVVVTIDGERLISASESLDPDSRADQGPVNALARALRRDLGRYQAQIEDMALVDYKVRILGEGTEAITRVWIESADAAGRRWATVGVSANIVDASAQALLDAILWKLAREQGTA